MLFVEPSRGELGPENGTAGLIGRGAALSWQMERLMSRSRRTIDAALKVKVVWEALREQATVADLAIRHQVHPNQIYGWKKQLQEHVARAFDPKIGRDAEAASNRAIEKLDAKIGQLTIENDFLSKELRPMSAPSGEWHRSRSGAPD